MEDRKNRVETQCCFFTLLNIESCSFFFAYRDRVFFCLYFQTRYASFVVRPTKDMTGVWNESCTRKAPECRYDNKCVREIGALRYKGRGCGSDEGSRRVVQLHQRLYVYRQTRQSILRVRVDGEPGKGVVSLEHVSA